MQVNHFDSLLTLHSMNSSLKARSGRNEPKTLGAKSKMNPIIFISLEQIASKARIEISVDCAPHEPHELSSTFGKLRRQVKRDKM
jgi:hypothetical protein